jgi:hypothetical protein
MKLQNKKKKGKKLGCIYVELVILTIEQTLTVIRAAVGNHNTMILQKSKNQV